MSESGAGELVLAIDQGTTGTTALLLDERLEIRGRGYREFPQIYPEPGQVEHDPEAIWASVVSAMEEALRTVGESKVGALGITNQRETTLLWDRSTGRPVANALVWQDRRTAGLCHELRQAGHEARIRRRTGLVLDPYFSATKIRWLLDNVAGLKARAEAGDIAFGTVDSYLIWRLTGGKVHVTDVSNAARTLLLDLETRQWSDELLALFGIPRALLPEVKASAGLLGATAGAPGVPDGTPISGVAGDQQAALFGQDCRHPGEAKCTYGTGAFLLMNVGEKPVPSKHGLLTTVAWTVGGETRYALEGSAFVAGALVQWLRDGLGFISRAAEIEALASSVPDSGGVVVVPALVGLGAPHWRPEARGLIAGISRGTTRAHIARAALEAIALQTVDLVAAMEADAGRRLSLLRVDGGAAQNDLLMQIQADLLDVEIVRPAMVESTALGAAKLAAAGAGLWGGRPPQPVWAVQRFKPEQRESWRREVIERWKGAVEKA